MVRSKNSCFKIITCGGGDSVDRDDHDDLEPLESKGLTDKRRWSFRKRSTRHRVLSNTVISETMSSGHKESPESTGTDFHAQSKPTVPEKVVRWKDEIPTLSTTGDSKGADPLNAVESTCKIDTSVYTKAENIDSLSSTENAIKINHELEESAATIIQAAIREYLAQREFLKLKNVVKLQAAVRGHLVRRQAVGTLRCVQAIVKLQGLVRARRARTSLPRLVTEDNIDGKHEKDIQIKSTGKENSGPKANRSYSSTEKLLSNGFARQLLETTSTKKQIHIKCDPSRADSAWKWLERWMSVSSDSAHALKSNVSPEYGEQGEKNHTAVVESAEIQVVSDPVDSAAETTLPLEIEENLITYDADNFGFQKCFPSSSTRDVMQQPQLDDASLSKTKETDSPLDTSQNQPDATSHTLPRSVSSRPDVDSEQPRRSMKRLASEQPETEGKKSVFGSRKVCNPVFAAVQSKFEELSSSTISGKSNSSSQVVEAESKLGSVSSAATSVARTKELSQAENSISHETKACIGGSECGTELSISSTLDSPDRSEAAREDFEHETEVIERRSSEPNGATSKVSILENSEHKNSSSNADSPLSYRTPLQQGKLKDVKEEDGVESVVALESPFEQPERNASDVQNQLETPTSRHMYSPEGSPRSHITAPESHGTPSSQVSANAKRNKSDKSASSHKRKSLSSSKGSPSNPNHDSGARSSTEQLPKDSKNGKRRGSFGTTRPDHAEQEPRDSSSNTLPSYMQATESARAKAAHANNSPRSSPDVLDKDINVKKRHSLPGANGKQISPRMQRSMSQVQQGAKGNGSHSNERKWQR